MNDRDLTQGFLESQRLANRSTTTISSYRRYLNHWVNWLGRQEHEPTLLTASREGVETFLAAHRIAPRTRYNYIARLAVLYRWLRLEGHTTHNPTLKIERPRRPHSHPRPITLEELKVAADQAHGRMRVWLLLAGLTGLRCKEIAGITVEDLFLGRTPPVLLVSQPKGWKQRIVPIHPDVEAAIRVYGIPKAGFLFPHLGVDPGRPVQPWTVSHEVAKHLRSLGIDATCHQLRHLFATECYQASRDLRLVQDLLGHRDPATTAIYAAFDQSQAAEVVCSLRLARPDPVRSGAGRTRPRSVPIVERAKGELSA